MTKIWTIASIIGWVIYITLFVFKKIEFQTGIPFLHNYLADLLALPLTLGLISFLLKKIYKNEFLQLGLIKISTVTIYFATLFEWILPNLSDAYTGDIWDVFCYFVGGTLFYFFELQKTYKSKNHVATF